MQIALASPDYLAVDRVALETMGIPAYAIGYMQYAAQLGVGQYDLSKIDIRGEKPEAVKKTFRLQRLRISSWNGSATWRSRHRWSKPGLAGASAQGHLHHFWPRHKS